MQATGAPTKGLATGDPARFVDLLRYPILDPEAPAAQALISRCCAELRASGACILPGFLTAAGASRLPAVARYLKAVGRRLDKLSLFQV